MTQTFLSITIPTYNRAPRLQQCLTMIAARIAELPRDHQPIEVLVVDNASTDDTEAVAAQQSNLFSKFRYERNESNLGIDGNIHRCSQLARGRWVQLLSDDDLLLPGALVTVINRLLRHEDADFVFLNVISFTDKLPQPPEYEPRIPVREDLIFTDPNQMVETCHIWLTFLSSFVFRRDAWNRSPALTSFVGTDIYLSYALLDLLSKAQKSVVVAQPLVAARAHFSGSYRIFYAFGHQWTELLTRYAPAIGFNARRMDAVLRRTVRQDLLIRVVRYRVEGNRLSPDERTNVFHSVRGPSLTAIMLWIAVETPQALVNAFVEVLRSARRALRGGRRRKIT